MDWKDLAPWIAIAITLSLSILVPLFTQIANNAHQMKMQKEKLDYERAQEKEKVYKSFLLNVGGAIAHATGEALIEAGASVYQIYLYAPTEWWEDLDALATYIRKYEWTKAEEIMQKLGKLISEELNKNKEKEN